MSRDYWHYLLSDASTGANICELPLTGVNFTEVLTGCGALSGEMSVFHPYATRSNLLGDRELTVILNDAPVWNGPVTGAEASRSGGTVQLTAREPSWYFSRRTLEVDKHYNADLFFIVRKLVTYMTTKTDATLGDIVAMIPRLNVSSGSAGIRKELALSGLARHTIQEVLDFIVTEDLPSGVEYRMDYRTGSNRQTCQRTLVLGAPLGSTSAFTLRELVLNDYNRSLDWERGATRTHARGAGITETAQNTGAVTAGTLLLEGVYDYSDTGDDKTLKAHAKNVRRLAQPPVQMYGAAWIPNPSLPYDAFDVGDTVPIDTRSPDILTVTGASRRIVQLTTTPANGGAPTVRQAEFNLPLDATGA